MYDDWILPLTFKYKYLFYMHANLCLIFKYLSSITIIKRQNYLIHVFKFIVYHLTYTRRYIFPKNVILYVNIITLAGPMLVRPWPERPSVSRPNLTRLRQTWPLLVEPYLVWPPMARPNLLWPSLAGATSVLPYWRDLG